jgi:hypothetical protein
VGPPRLRAGSERQALASLQIEPGAVDHETTDTKVDFALGGPIFGVAFRFSPEGNFMR